jgi:tetratricopeptide (TPR) repeat protein
MRIALPDLSRRTIMLTSLGVLGIAALAGGAWWWADAQGRRAEAAYASALARAEHAAGPQATAEARAAAARELEATLARYPSSRMAAQAAYELGNLRFSERDWARARAAYDIAAARAESPTLRTLARLGLGYTWEGEHNWAKAVEAYTAAAAGLRPGDFGYEELTLALARAQEQAGKKTEAIETYRRFLKTAPQSLRASDVRSHLADLGVAP